MTPDFIADVKVKLLQNISNKRIYNNASIQLINETPLSISFGLDAKVNITQDIKKVIENAEQQMYQSKATRKTGDGSLSYASYRPVNHTLFKSVFHCMSYASYRPVNHTLFKSVFHCMS